MARLKSITYHRRPAQMPSWTDDPIRDEMAWQDYLESSKYDDDDEDADTYWADAMEDDWR